MWRSCVSSPDAARSDTAGPRTSTAAVSPRPGATRTVRAPRGIGSVTSSVHVSGSMREGGSVATPCEWSVRRKSTGSPPAPTSRRCSRCSGSGRDLLLPQLEQRHDLLRRAERIRQRRAVVERDGRSEEHTSELQSREKLVCRHLLEKKKKKKILHFTLKKKKKKYKKK